LVTTAGNGRATITAMSGDVSGTAAVTVQQAPDTVTLAPGSLGFSALEDTATLVATVLDANGHAIEGAVVTWSSDNNAIATVNASGLVTAAGSGEAMVTAVSGGVPGTAAVTVEQKADSVSVSPNAATMAIGETVRLTALAFDANGHKMVGAQFKWGSSDALIASVDGNGLVRGTGEGTAAITAQNGSALGSAEVTVGNPDRAVLVALYHSTGGDQWANNTNWLQNTPLGHWHGVETDQQGYVTRLDLRSNGLDGSIPPELGNLTRLVVLYLHANRLSGPIPSELGNLSKLSRLFLNDNDLTGPIPSELGNLSKLRDLILSDNDLADPIPSELGKLSNLRRLSLSDNDLTGPIPPELGNLSSLLSLDLSDNDLTGPIPPELGNLSSLLSLTLLVLPLFWWVAGHARRPSG